MHPQQSSFLQGAPVDSAVRPNESEQEISRIEQSWGDCAHGFRTGVRWSWRPEGDTLHMQSLLEVHELLEVYRAQFEEGDQSAILWAIRECARQNLPLPYWCATGFQERIGSFVSFVSKSVTLDEVFDVSRKLPAGKRGQNVRLASSQSVRLYVRVWKIHAKEPRLSKDACIRRAREELKLPMCQRKATTLFNERERQQKPFRDALRMNWPRI